MDLQLYTEIGAIKGTIRHDSGYLELMPGADKSWTLYGYKEDKDMEKVLAPILDFYTSTKKEYRHILFNLDHKTPVNCDESLEVKVRGTGINVHHKIARLGANIGYANIEDNHRIHLERDWESQPILHPERPAGTLEIDSASHLWKGMQETLHSTIKSLDIY